MNLDSHEKLPAEVLEYLINHIFLPPNVPQEDDYRFEYENILLKVVTDALIQFKTCVTNDWFSVMDSVIDMVKNLQKIVEVKGIIHEERLRDALRDLCVKGRAVKEKSIFFPCIHSLTAGQVERYCFIYESKTVGS